MLDSIFLTECLSKINARRQNLLQVFSLAVTNQWITPKLSAKQEYKTDQGKILSKSNKPTIPSFSVIYILYQSPILDCRNAI